MSAAHPSRLAIDRHALGLSDSTVASHLQGCALCAEHVQKISVELPLPAWVKGIDEARPSAAFSWWRPVFVAAAMLAVGFIAVLTPREPAVQAKGAPAVQVWMNRQGQVSVWSGDKLHV